MKIKSLNIISYGKFKNFKLDFSDGLNVITGKNEAGKSTVMSFIRAMLYGFSGRGATPVSNERKRFMPWGGSSMSGEICLEDDLDNTTRVFRESGKSLGLDTVEAINRNGEKIKFDGESFVGIGEEAFAKTFFIRQLQSAVSGEDGEIENKLINLTYSGDEDISYHSAVQSLTNEIKVYKPLRGSGGLLETLKQRITALNSEKAEAEILRKSSFERCAQGIALSEDINKYREQLSSLRKQKEEAQKRAKNDKSSELKIRLESLKKAYETAEAEFVTADAELEALAVFGDEADKIIYEPFSDEKQLSSQIEKQSHTLAGLRTSLIIFLSLLLVSVVAGIFLPIIFAASSVFLTATLVLFFRYGATAKAKAETQSEWLNAEERNRGKKAELAKYGAESLKDYTEKRSKYLIAENRREVCLSTFEKYGAEYAECFALYESALADKPEAEAEHFYTPDEIAEEEHAVRDMLERAIEEKSRIDGYLSAGKADRGLDIIMTEQTELLQRLDDAALAYEALLLARETLDEVYTEMSSDYTPRVSARASEILAEITDGAHNELYIDKKYSVKMGTGGLKALGFFSAGTADQVYLAVRLAVSDILFDGKNPLILDDIFMTYDSEREANTLKMLKKRAENGQQIIVFSCRPLSFEDMNEIQLQ